MGNAIGDKQKPVTQVRMGPLSKGRHVQPAKRVSNVSFSKNVPDKFGVDFYIRDDGTIAIKPNTLHSDRFYLEHHSHFLKSKSLLVRHYELVGSFTRNKFGYLALPDHIEHNKFAFHYTGSAKENYISGEAFAALLGALKKAGFCDVSLNHWSNQDGTSPKPSKSHKLGINGDIRPLNTNLSGSPVNLLNNPAQYDVERNQRLVDALRAFGWKDILFYKNPKTGYIPKGARHFKGHEHHFHVQKFQPKILRYK